MPAAPVYRPDFIIAGAMKSGTTSLHHILAQHPQVFIPAPEIHFFCVDDIVEVPEAFGRYAGRWAFHDYGRDYERMLAWYEGFFKAAQPGQILGEDSTTYLASAKAPARIAALLPSVKLIFMLRDPVSRTYSHYWHLVRTGRAVHDFEKTLCHSPGHLLTRSFYKPQLQRYLAVFPSHQIKVVLFEEFVSQMQEVVDAISAFLELRTPIDLAALDTHRNAAGAPFSVTLQRLQNKMFRNHAMTPYRSHFPDAGLPQQGPWERLTFTLVRALRWLNRSSRPYPPMKPDTRAFLEKLFAKENQGLSDLLGRDVKPYWPYMDA